MCSKANKKCKICTTKDTRMLLLLRSKEWDSLEIATIGATCCDRLVSRGYGCWKIERYRPAGGKMSLAKATAQPRLFTSPNFQEHCRTASNAVVVSGFLFSVAIYFVCQFVGFVLLGWLSVFYLRRCVLLGWTLSRAGHAVTAIFVASPLPRSQQSFQDGRPSLARNTHVSISSLLR